MSDPRYTLDEIARRGQAIYDAQLRQKLEPTFHGQVVVIDVETGEYEVDADHLTAARRARAKRPGAVLFAARVGYPALARIGGRISVRGR